MFYHKICWTFHEYQVIVILWLKIFSWLTIYLHLSYLLTQILFFLSLLANLVYILPLKCFSFHLAGMYPIAVFATIEWIVSTLPFSTREFKGTLDIFGTYTISSPDLANVFLLKSRKQVMIHFCLFFASDIFFSSAFSSKIVVGSPFMPQSISLNDRMLKIGWE